MAQDLFKLSSEIQELYQQASDILAFDLAEVCFEGPEEALKQTNVTQPAIFVHSMALARFVSEKGLSPDLVAGHSLGEYSALCTVGSVSFADGLKLVKRRGELMHQAGQVSPGTMAAIIGLPVAELDEICAEASVAGTVCVANYNSSIQTVISGDVSGVESAMEIAKRKGAKRVTPLAVGGAFHSPLMSFAIDGFAETLQSVTIADAAVPVFSNVTAAPVQQSSEIKELLIRQLTSPVRWVASIEAMVDAGTSVFYEVGPGNVLTGLLKRINKDVRGVAINSLEALNSLEN